MRSGFGPKRYIRSRPSATFHRRADLGPAVTIHRPSGLKRASATDPECASEKRCTISPLATSQTMTSWSRPADTRSRPSGLNETVLTRSVWPRSTSLAGCCPQADNGLDRLRLCSPGARGALRRRRRRLDPRLTELHGGPRIPRSDRPVRSRRDDDVAPCELRGDDRARVPAELLDRPSVRGPRPRRLVAAGGHDDARRDRTPRPRRGPVCPYRGVTRAPVRPRQIRAV